MTPDPAQLRPLIVAAVLNYWHTNRQSLTLQGHAEHIADTVLAQLNTTATATPREE